MLCQIVVDPISKMSCLNVASILGCRASENVDCYPKMSQIKKTCFKHKLKLKIKKEKNQFYLVQIKNSFAHFRKIKNNIKQFFFNFYFCILFFDFQGACDFLKVRTLPLVRRASGAEIADFFRILKIYVISRNAQAFKIRQKKG